MHVTFICIGDDRSPSTRLRVLNYLPHLEARGIRHRVILSDPSSRLRRTLQRFAGVLQARRSDRVFIQKITLPIFMIKWLKRNTTVIYDYDDAIYLESAGWPSRATRLRHVLRRSDRIVAGNRVLAEHARGLNSNVTILPTPAADTASEPLAVQDGPRVVVGWIGSAHNLYNIDMIKEPLTTLMNRNRQLKLHLVSDGSYRIAGLDERIRNLAWSLATEHQQVCRFDIGIMPLVDSEWNRGKCAFKAIQMMAQGKPVIASPVGMNCEVIHNEINGYLAESHDEWVAGIQRLVDSRQLRITVGTHALRTVKKKYALSVLGEQFCDILRDSPP